MLQSWRQKLREAETAFKEGQLDAACRLLKQEGLGEYRPGRKLAVRIGDRIVKRAEEQLSSGNTSAGWRDVDEAESLLGDDPMVRKVRGLLVEQGLADIERLLEAGDTREAIMRIERLQSRYAATGSLRDLWQLARHLQQASQFSLQGDFASADSQLAAAETLRPQWKWFSARRKQVRLNQATSRQLKSQLHQALVAEDWSAVLTTAEGLLEIAPHYRAAKEARRRAWAIVGLGSQGRAPAKSFDNGAASAAAEETSRHATGDTNYGISNSQVDTVNGHRACEKFLMWIDAVGGFLVCLGEQFVLGPPTSEKSSDIPILADLSRRHAVIRRDGEGWLIDPRGQVALDHEKITSICSLSEGVLITLGESVELRFRKPHALATTARLEFVSHHKTTPSADAVILMTDSCVLGSSPQSHVVCSDWENDLVFFRKEEQLHYRTEAQLEVDGRTIPTAGRIEPGARIESEQFSVSFEGVL